MTTASNTLALSDEKWIAYLNNLKNDHRNHMRRACDANYGSQADRIQSMCRANNIADEFFRLTHETIESMP